MILIDFATIRRHLFVAIYGMGSWLSINAMYVELPLLVNIIPEGWTFASYMVVILQLVCLLALLYSCVAYKFESLITGNVYAISVMCLMSVIGILMSAFVYNIPSTVSGEAHSVLLLIAIGIMGLPCTVSDMLFMPFISKFKESHIVATYFIGMGLSALVPSAISFAQVVPHKENDTDFGSEEHWVEGSFNVSVFMCLMAVIMAASLCGFLLLVRDRKINAVVEISSFHERLEDDGNSDASVVVRVKPKKKKLTIAENWFLLLLSCFLGGAQNSIMPTVLPIACRPYGQQTYHLANSLFIMANPVFCFIPFFVSIRHNFLFVIHTIFCTACLVFFIVMGAIGGIADHNLATILICIIAPCTSGLMSWERAAIAEVLRNDSSERGLFWCGTFTQIGAFVLAIVMFLLTTVFKIYGA